MSFDIFLATDIALEEISIPIPLASLNSPNKLIKMHPDPVPISVIYFFIFINFY